MEKYILYLITHRYFYEIYPQLVFILFNAPIEQLGFHITQTTETLYSDTMNVSDVNVRDLALFKTNLNE